MFSSHGTIMIFFVAMPFLTGLMNIVMPQQIGARDVAFPFLNSVSLWLTAAGAALVMISLVIGKFSTAGWTGYPPYSGIEYSPGVGVDYWIWALLISGVGTTLTGINFVVTILKRRAPGMTLMRMPLFAWTALCTSLLMVFAFPALTVVAALLGLDRYLGMHFFTNDAGGNMMNYVNLLWIWGHPEVYILILPAFGIYSEVVATFARKRLFGYASLVYATVAIAILSFTVWLHHFFTMGSSANVNAFFGIMTMIIAVPTGVKIFDWLLTMYRGRIRMTAPMLWTMGFIVTFVIGGMTGVLLAVPPVDYLMHNTTFLVAHFHNMLIPGALFGYFAGYMYWFPKAFGFTPRRALGHPRLLALADRLLARLHAALFPGLPRHAAAHGALQRRRVAALSDRRGAWRQPDRARHRRHDHAARGQRPEPQRAARLTGDPWDGRTLEWLTSSPPAPYNFAVVPEVRESDAFHEMKRRGVAYQRPARYADIVMPRNTGIGVIIGGLAFALGFAMVWHIWWLAVASGLGILITVAIRAFDDDTEFVMPAAEVQAIEDARRQMLAAAPRHVDEHAPVRDAALARGAT